MAGDRPFGATTCGIQVNGSLWCWGQNWGGALGIGNIEWGWTHQSPTLVSGDLVWTDLAAGRGTDSWASDICAIKTNQEFACWGKDEGSAGTRGATSPVPVAVSPGTSWTKLSQTESFGFCGIQADSSLWCWGPNTYGQVGDGTFTSRHQPTRVAGGGSWADVSMGWEHTCGLRVDGSIWCWGNNWAGQLGNGTNNQILVPTPIAGGGTWKQIASFELGNCAIKSDDTLWCWGRGAEGQLGNGLSDGSLVPTVVSGGSTWKQITAGYQHVCGIKGDDTAWCWGSGYRGQLGDGGLAVRSVPQAVAGGGTWRRLDAGEDTTCGIRSDDTLWCWGAGNNGGTAGGNFLDSTIPKLVASGTNWKQVSAGAFCHSCALKSDDTAWCWGLNQFNQLGLSQVNTTVANQPKSIASAFKWRQVEAGGNSSCAIRTDGSLWCWGLQLPTPYLPMPNSW